jgi:NADP-dependent 3-hydroxy acid dehydrogenase YdfG
LVPVHRGLDQQTGIDGDATRAVPAYQGVTALTAVDIANVVAFAVTRPPQVNLDEIAVRPIQQAAAHKVVRRS